jgi:hypothetical protein
MFQVVSATNGGLMNGSSTVILNRLLATIYRSLPMYLTEADPWVRHNELRARDVLATIVADQRRDCHRIAELILDRYGRIELGEFPMEFTDLHFLSLDYLIGELVRHQKQDIATVEACVDRLQHDPAARTLAQEVLGSQRAHLEMLEELAGQSIASSSTAS